MDVTYILDLCKSYVCIWIVINQSCADMVRCKGQIYLLFERKLITLLALTLLGLGQFGRSFRQAIFEKMAHGSGISCETTHRWPSLDLTDDKSIMVQVMSVCLKATLCCLSHCWPSSMLPYCITRPGWLKELTSRQHFSAFLNFMFQYSPWIYI